MPKVFKLPKGKTFEFKKASGGGEPKYPWDAMFTGDLVLIEKGTDYTVETDDMPPKIKTAARKRYKIVSISKIDHDGNKLVDSLIVQARPMTDEERVVEDAKRAQEKIAKAERKAADDAETETTETAAA